ncbi:NAD-dependent epimerase/dehydratase family protein [Sporomusa silvacetica]|uniref:NAD-dependent epimerase/dehydratase family protein n=1 Tax=Sporomusa silvacetica TaxID=55504 RepID=UPI001181BD59
MYTATKQALESLSRYYTQTTSMRMITLKLLDTYGPNDPRPKLFSLLNRIAQTGETLDMSGGQMVDGVDGTG